MSTPQPATPAMLFDRLDRLAIAHKTISHPAVYTVEEAQAVRDDFPGGHSKNLFLRNKKGQMWLITCEESLVIDLKALAIKLGAGRFSFASTDRLMRYLGVIPGAVTPFAVLNDGQKAVHMVLDRQLLEHDVLNFHPLDNTQTTAISPNDLIRFLNDCNHPPQIIDLVAL